MQMRAMKQATLFEAVKPEGRGAESKPGGPVPENCLKGSPATPFGTQSDRRRLGRRSCRVPQRRCRLRALRLLASGAEVPVRGRAKSTCRPVVAPWGVTRSDPGPVRKVRLY